MSKYLTAYFNTKNILSVMIACTLLLTLAACGSTSVAGIDAHEPNCFFQPETFEPYQKFVAACGLTVTDEITLRPVKR